MGPATIKLLEESVGVSSTMLIWAAVFLAMTLKRTDKKSKKISQITSAINRMKGQSVAAVVTLWQVCRAGLLVVSGIR